MYFEEAHQKELSSTFDADKAAVEALQGICGARSEWIVKNSYTTKHNGVRHVYLRQFYQGLEIANSPANVNFDKHGRVINVGEVCYTKYLNSQEAVSHVSQGQPRLSPVDSIFALASHLGLTDRVTKENIVVSYDKHSRGFVVTGHHLSEDEEIPVNMKFIQTAEGTLNLTWNLVVRLKDNWFDAHVSAHSGKVLSMIDWVRWDSYDAYAIPNENPLLGERTVRTDPADKTASPKGWLDQGLGTTTTFTTTVGNNVYAQLNPTGGSGWIYNYRADGNVNKTFQFPIDFFSQPYSYKDAAITNLFYWNNVIHDIFYLLGFDEASGNFQENNFNKGGLGNDAVQANAQDGSGFNNANFATPPDGQRPRMRMYLWNQISPMIDGDLDSGIIVHEYGHGISTRLTGGPSNSNCLASGQAGGMGEGWGDFWAVNFLMKASYKATDAFPMGNYAAGRGIRAYPYSTDFAIDPQTYDFINRAGYNSDGNVHAKGSVWCTILNEAYWEMVGKHGFDPDWYRGTGGNNVLLQNVVDGLKIQPCRPTFVDARNAILLADKQNYDSKHVCDLWVAFARRGLGFSAKGDVKPVVEAYDLPPQCM